MRYSIFTLLCFLSLTLQAQETIPRCNFDDYYKEQMKSSDYRMMLEKEEIAFQKYLKNKKGSKSSVYTIPVVVHIVKNESNTEMDITDEEVIRQIEILNETYNLQNADTVLVPDEFQPFIGNPQIEFCLATVDANGYSTSGITRHSTEVVTFSSVSDNIKHSELGGVDAWDVNSYLNIWVGKITTGVLGYSHLPNASIPDSEHGLVVAYPYFGETEHPNYGKGKTAVHEIGHYLNLKHPWGIGGCDSNNDWVEDTPMSEESYYGSPVHPQASCGSNDMFMNYMDYVDDAAMVMFSQGQADRMLFTLNYYREELQESNGCGTPLINAEPIVHHLSAEGVNDGSIDLNITSGISPYTIVWNTGDTTQILGNVPTGEYSVLVSDAIGQELSFNFTISYYGNVIDSDNFESYDADSLLFEQSEIWTALCADSFAANIETIAAVEGEQYLEINAADGLNTFKRDLGELGENAYELSFKMYLPEARAATYIVYHDTDCSGMQSAYQIQFNVDGQGFVKVGGQNIPFEFPQGQWVEVSQLVDMDRDLVELTIANENIADWSFDWTIEDEWGTPRLGAIVFDSEIDTTGMVHYYIDDYKLQLAPNSNIGIEELIEEVDVVLYPNPAQDQITIRYTDINPENSEIYLVNSLGQVMESRSWNVSSTPEFIFDVSGYHSGVYFVRIQSDKSFKTLKFIKQN